MFAGEHGAPPQVIVVIAVAAVMETVVEVVGDGLLDTCTAG
ncbi:MAG: hypothetical protein WDA71_04720 [Actinomycetota bacterium]